MGAVPQNWLIPQKFHQNQNCRVSKSKIIMCLWSVALKARKAGNRPRTFFAGRTVVMNILCVIGGKVPRGEKFCKKKVAQKRCCIYIILPHRQTKYPVDFGDELEIGDVRYDKMT